MKVLVTGGRNFSNRKLLEQALDMINETQQITSLVTGGCKTWSSLFREYIGADYLAECWAIEQAIPVHRHEAKWQLYGRKAGPIRNRMMLRLHEDVEYVIAFKGGRGTQDMVRAATEKGVVVLDVIEGD